MWRHAIVAVTVQVEPDAVERHAEMGDDAPGRLQNCRRRRVWCGIETEVSRAAAARRPRDCTFRAAGIATSHRGIAL